MAMTFCTLQSNNLRQVQQGGFKAVKTAVEPQMLQVCLQDCRWW